MVQNELKREIAKELYIKMVLENQEVMEKEHLVDTAKIAIAMADVFVEVLEENKPNKPFSPSAFVKS